MKTLCFKLLGTVLLMSTLMTMQMPSALAKNYYIDTAHTMSVKVAEPPNEQINRNPGDISISCGNVAANYTLYIDANHKRTAKFTSGFTTFTPEGSVTEGILAIDQTFYINKAFDLRATFALGQIAYFNPDGHAFAGYLAADQSFYINDAHTLKAVLAQNGKVVLSNNGRALDGVLAKDTTLYANRAHTKTAKYQAGTRVQFNGDGSVISAELPQ